MLNHMATLFFLGTSVLFAVVAAPIYTPPAMQEGPLFSVASPAFIICGFCFLIEGHSDQCGVVPTSL